MNRLIGRRLSFVLLVISTVSTVILSDVAVPDDADAAAFDKADADESRSAAPDRSARLKLVRRIETKPFAGGKRGVRDSESLAYCRQDDTFWLGDDDGNAIYQFARSGGRLLRKVSDADLIAAFPDAGKCDNGTRTPCSYVNELETVACHPRSGDLYVVNTVNDSRLDPPVDKQAIFRIRGTGEDVEFRAWHPLPAGNRCACSAMCWIDERLFFGGKRELVEYDFSQRRFARTDADGSPIPEFTSKHGGIVGLSYRAPTLWLLTTQKKLIAVDWRTKSELGVWKLNDVADVDLRVPKGLQVVDDEIYVVEGDPPHQILVLRFQATTR